MTIIYESENGKIIMGTSTNYLVSEIDGLSQVTADKNIIKYVGVAGQKTLEKSPNARVITITGRVLGDKTQCRFNCDRLCEVFDNTIKGTLSLNLWGKLRKIDCMPDSAPTFGKVKHGYRDFMLVLECDNPYFRDWEDTNINLYRIENNLISGMTLPRVFSYRYTEGHAINNGSIDVEPIITITAGEEGTPIETGLIILNETTGAEIKLNYSPSDGEVITINIADRNIVSSIDGNITRHADKYTDLSKFILKRGQNKIKFTNLNSAQKIDAKITYSNHYIEGVL